MASIAALEEQARQIRARIIEMVHHSGAAHLGSALSCVDIVTALYGEVLSIDPQEPNSPLRDRFIMSKGHAIATLYAVLAEYEFFSKDLLSTFAENNSLLPEQPSPRCAPGVELATGSLGHGLSVGIGMALAGRIQNQNFRVYTLLGDGECNEGSVWEAAMMAPAHNLENITVIVDFNKWQGTGRSTETLALTPLRAKWQAFGWNTYEIEGHDMKSLVEVLRSTPDGSGKPVAIIANTVKGKGVSFMEDDDNWHYLTPNAEHVRRAKEELGVL